MKITRCFLSCLCLLLFSGIFSSSASAGSFALEVNEMAGYDGPWPLVGGLPFPEGELRDASQIRILDAGGREVPAQVDVSATWRDGSIRWALAGFNASAQGSYRVEFGAGVRRAAPATPLVVEEGAEGLLRIDTGAAVYEFLPDRLLPESARVGPVRFLSGSGAGAYLLDNHGRLARVAGEEAAVSSETVLSGPVRAVIRREGWYVTEGGERVARARAWFYFTAGSPYLRVTHSLIFTEDTNELWVRDYGLEFKTPESPGEVLFALGESDEVFSPRGTAVDLEPVSVPFEGQEIYMHQDTYPHFLETDYRAVVGRHNPDQSPRLLSRGERDGRGVFWIDPWNAVGDVAGDWGHARYAQHGLTLVTPYLAQRFPKEIAFGPGSARVELWSSRGGRELDLRTSTLIVDYWQDWSEYYSEWNEGGVEALSRISSDARGMARTHEVWLIPHAVDDGPDSITRRAAAASDPPLVLADPSWLSDTDAFGWPFHPKDEVNFPEAEAAAESYWEGLMDLYRGQPVGGGFLDWGKTRTMRGGRGSFFRLFSGTMDYYLRLHTWGAYVRSGERGYFNYGSWINQFAADIGKAHWTAGEKFRGGRATHGGYGRSHTPLYWGLGSELGATASLAGYLNEYFLTGNERLKDVAEMIGESYLDRWEPDDVPRLARRVDGVFNTMAGLASLYVFTWNDDFAEMAGQLADTLIDLDNPTGLSDEIRFGNLYKVDRNLFWLYTYHRATGDERARQAILKSLDFKYRFGLIGLSSGTQDWAGLLYSIAYKWTGNPSYLRVLNYLMPVGVRRREILATSFLENHFTTINMPALMSVLSEVEEPVEPFPAAEYYRLPEPSRILFRKADGAEQVTFLATAWMEDAHIEPTGTRVTPHHGDRETAVDPLAGVVVDFEQAFITRYSGRQYPHVYSVRITIPANAPAGLYFLDIPRAERVRVLESSASEIGVYAPQGVAIQGDTMPNYFYVGDETDELSIHLNQPMEILRPDGSVAVESSRGNIGELRIPVNGHTGAWSVRSFSDAVIGLLNIEPIISRSPGRLPVGSGLEAVTRFEPPSETPGFVPGIDVIGWQALHLPDRETVEFPRGRETETGYEFFPGSEGTVEFWFRPNWTSAQLVFRTGNNYTDFRFLRAGSHAFLYRRGRRRAGSPELASIQLWLRNELEDPGGPGRDSGEFTTGNPTLGGHTSQYWFEAGEWYHIAMSWRLSPTEGEGEHMTALFVNGKAVEQENRSRLTGSPRELPSGEFPLAETSERIEIGPLNGTIAQLRISDTVRYESDFEPPARLDAPDADTLVIFPLDGEMTGQAREGREVLMERQ